MSATGEPTGTLDVAMKHAETLLAKRPELAAEQAEEILKVVPNHAPAAFLLARAFVFKQSTQQLHRSAFFFVVVNLIAVLQTWLVSMVLAYYLLPAFGVRHFVPEIAHAVGVVVPVFTSYLGHKHWSFAEKSPS